MLNQRHSTPSRDFLTLLSGSFSGYFLVLLVSPIITRVYTPEEFGSFAVFGAIVAIFSIIATLSFEFGILGALSRQEALRFSLTATFLGSLILLLSLFIILSLTYFGVLKPLLTTLEMILAFVSCFIAVISNISINSAIHSNHSSIAARGTFFNLSTRSLLQVGFGYFFGGLNSLIYGDIFGRLVGWLAMERGVFKVTFKSFFSYRKIILKHIKRNASYVFFLTPASAIETALAWLLAPLFTIFYDPLVGGVVAMVQRLASAPLTIINQSLGQIFHNYAAKFYEKHSLLIIRNTLLITFLTLPLLIVLMIIFWFYGEKVALIIFGDQWGIAGYVTFMLLPLYYLYFLSLITNRLLMVMSRTYIKLMASITHLILLLGALPFAISMGLGWDGGMIVLVGCLICSHLVVFIAVLFLIYYCPRPGSFVLDKLFSKRIESA